MKTNIDKDLTGKRIVVSAEFKAERPAVWDAFTKAAILDQWWGPTPWRCETAYQRFEPGGHWHYAMIGPEGDKAWGRMNYYAIDYPESFDMQDIFSDEQGGMHPDLPRSKGKVVFKETEQGTRVDFIMDYETVEGLQQVVEMGFEEGISMCFDQLENCLGSN
jgi:uncharacterized protein YndB with AHSA1/START domain